MLFNFCNNYLLVEVPNKEIFEFLAGSLIRVFKIFFEGCSMTNAKVYQVFHDDKKVEEHWYRLIANTVFVKSRLP